MNRYRIILTVEQSDELVNLVLNKYSIVESIEYLTFSDEEILNDHFKVIGFWYTNNPSYGTKYYYRDKDSKVFNKLYEFLKPLIRDFKIEELGL